MATSLQTRKDLVEAMDACSSALIDFATLARLMGGPSKVPEISKTDICEMHDIDEIYVQSKEVCIVTARKGLVRLTLNIEYNYGKYL